MKCKFCGAELDEASPAFCPECGKAQSEPASAGEPVTCEAAPEAEAGAAPEAEASAQPEPAAPEKGKSGKTALICGVAIAALLIVIALICVRIFKDRAPAGPAAEPGGTLSQEDTQTPAGEDTEAPASEDAEPEAPAEAGNGVSYTVTAQELEGRLDDVVSTCGADLLTNRALGLYYWQQYNYFASNYGSYLSMILDTSAGLDTQMYNEEMTWQQTFLEAALQMFGSMSALCQEADADGYTLSEEDLQSVDNQLASLESYAAVYGFDSVDGFLQSVYGPSATKELYADFLQRSLKANGYLQQRVDALSYTDQDVSDYYDAHAEDYEAEGVAKDDTALVNVRHILIQPDGTDEDGNYTEEAWLAAEQKANELYEQWKAGAASEDSFAELAGEQTQDSGSAANGGLYEEVYPGQMVTEFNDWCFDAARRPGDTGIVKTTYGYHIMYFVGTGETPYWYARALEDYLQAQMLSIENEIYQKYEPVNTPENAAIVDVLHPDETAAGEN